VIRPAVAHGAAERQAVEPGNHHVEDQQIEALLFDALQGGGAVGQAFARVALVPQVQAHELTDVALVFYNEDTCHRFFTARSPFGHACPVEWTRTRGTCAPCSS
jgi:hypothetical protein